MSNNPVAPSAAPISVAPKTKRGRGRPPKAAMQQEGASVEPEVRQPLREDVSPAVLSDRRPMRDEDSRAAAARRAAEILGNFDGSEFQNVDEFKAPPAPDGWSYEWKVKSVLNKEDPGRWNAYRKTGWTEVPAFRHPEMMPTGDKSPIIERKGMVLMERPLEVTRRFQERDRQAARDQMRTKQEQLNAAPQGQFERKNKDSSLVKVSKSYEPMPIPDDK
jgi:hypothetical protein